MNRRETGRRISFQMFGKTGEMRQGAPSHHAAALRIPPRQDVANEHQRKDENLGFACIRPKESRTRRPSFP